jgi:hypothetical protein
MDRLRANEYRHRAGALERTRLERASLLSCVGEPLKRINSLDELDPPAWGEPEFNSHLVTTCRRLRRGARRMSRWNGVSHEHRNQALFHLNQHSSGGRAPQAGN